MSVESGKVATSVQDLGAEVEKFDDRGASSLLSVRGLATKAAAEATGSGLQTANAQSLNKHGTIYVQSTSNNTICTLVDGIGNPVAWCSAGSLGFKNARKSTTYAAQATAEKIAAKSQEKGFFLVRVVMKGLGYGKQSAVRAIIKSGIKVSSMHELTPVPYNGCRAPKRRRT